MKSIICTILLLGIFQLGHTQSSDFSRNGKFLLESGFTTLGGFSNGSGFLYQNSDGSSATLLGIDAGKFLSENFALKLKLGVLSNGGSLTTILGGGKYYLGGVAPLEITAGLISGSGNSIFAANGSIGYAIVLADNIYFEPAVGVSILEDETLLGLKANFAMMF